ncbi:hypothetical protein LCGC14_0146250 [marine sediment metagenome]|uniref:Uncharacterized protein n=1 Tax=marine sediment metagenome TaxID=412755 RepID=A0A0F9V3F3_9ZZZZ
MTFITIFLCLTILRHLYIFVLRISWLNLSYKVVTALYEYERDFYEANKKSINLNHQETFIWSYRRMVWTFWVWEPMKMIQSELGYDDVLYWASKYDIKSSYWFKPPNSWESKSGS